MTAVYLSPLTHTTLGRGATSGYWATYLKAAGYDGIILTGASPRPVYLYIDEGKAELRDAANFWGLGTPARPKIVCAKPWATGRQKFFASAPPAKT